MPKLILRDDLIATLPVSHGRATFQTASPPVTCPHCGRKLDVFSWVGGLVDIETNFPSEYDAKRRLSIVFRQPQLIKVERPEDVESQTARPAITFRCEEKELLKLPFVVAKEQE